MNIFKYKKTIIAVFIALAIGSAFLTTKLNFVFSFEHFFPKGDPDLDYYKSFIKDFEADDNFLLVAIENPPTVFDSTFLDKFHKFSLDLRDIELITKTQSLTQLKKPVKTPFGLSMSSMLHINDPSFYESDKADILSDKSLVNNLIDSEGTTLSILCKTTDNISIPDAVKLITEIENKSKVYGFDSRMRMLGRAYFQRELMHFQKREMTYSFFASILLVTLIMVVLYRKPIGIAISLGSIALGLLLFLGILGLTGTELTLISALFPVIMLIVGSSDVIHIFTKYVDELNKGVEKEKAMQVTIKEIGLATLMTSLTTAVGFASLAFSKLKTIQEFGLYASIGVLTAYITVILFTTSLLSFFDADKIVRSNYKTSRWNGILNSIYKSVLKHPKRIYILSAVIVLACLYGITLIKTNYSLEDGLPIGAKVTEDFKFFEEKFAGFRPLEIALKSKNGADVTEYEVMTEVNKLENHLMTYAPIKSTFSLASFYRNLNKLEHYNDNDYNIFPETEEEFYGMKKMVDRIMKDDASILVSKAKDKTRISTKIQDIGADNVKLLSDSIDKWIANNINTSLLEVKRTGISVILDKNAEYVSSSILYGLGLSILVISILIGFLFKTLRIVLIVLIVNILPLIFAGALLGYLNINLEAGVSIMFAIIFGISVDDSIHFLGRYRLCRHRGLNNNDAIHQTIFETGKAIIFTTIVLFFGFFNMIFSVYPPTWTIGLLISVTLVGAMICDLYLLPSLLRHLMPDDSDK